MLVRTEDRHADVVRAFRKSLEEGRALWATSYILVETVALLDPHFTEVGCRLLPPIHK